MGATKEVPTWATDRDGRELRASDRITWQPYNEDIDPYTGTVLGFEHWTCLDKGERARSDRYTMEVLFDNHTVGRMAVEPGRCVRIARLVAVEDEPTPDVVVGFPDVVMVGDVVGVLDNGPSDLHGRVGEVTMTAYSNALHTIDEVRPPDAIYVVCDLAHEGWCRPDQLELVYPGGDTVVPHVFDQERA